SAAELNEGLSDVLSLAAQHDDARIALARALDLVAVADRVSRARLYRKIGVSHSLQRNFVHTAREFDLADKEVGEAPAGAATDWWEEKVRIQLERMHLFYWQGMVKEMRELADQYRAVIGERAAPVQRARFLKMIALSMLMDSRFQPSHECVALAKRAVAASEEADDVAEGGHVTFTYGLIQVFG